MNRFSSKGLLVSVTLHTVFFLALSISFLLSTCAQPKIAQHVFQLQMTPPQGITSAIVEKPKLVAKSESKPITPKPEPKHKSIPKVESKAPKEIIKKDTLSYKDFMKNQGPPKTKDIKAVAVKAVNIPKIPTKDIRKNLEQKLSSMQALSESVITEYKDLVRLEIDSVWDYPESFAGYKNDAIFKFDVDKFGRISNVHIVKTSGSSFFDESVKDAFSKISSVKPTPLGKTLSLQVTFSKK